MADNTEEHRLSFPQRYWLLLCIIVAIISPIVVGWLDAAAHHQSYKEATEQRPVSAGSGSSGISTPGSAPAPAAGAAATDSAK